MFEIDAAMPVPIVSHDQVLFVTLRDRWERVVARVHVTYTDARTLSRGGFQQWYPAEPVSNRSSGNCANCPRTGLRQRQWNGMDSRETATDLILKTGHLEERLLVFVVYVPKSPSSSLLLLLLLLLLFIIIIIIIIIIRFE